MKTNLHCVEHDYRELSDNPECPRCKGSVAAPCSSPTIYAKRDLEELGKYYFRHINAMTTEKLHSKSDIAAELAVRDAIIDELLGKNEKGQRP